MKKIGILIIVVFLIVILVVFLSLRQKNENIISISTIQGLTIPEPDEQPVSSITETEQFTGHISWSPEPLNGIFDYSTEYTAQIKLEAKPGYTFSGIPANFFSVAGAKTTNEANTGFIKAVFSETAPKVLEVVNISLIPGINVHAEGTAVETITENEQYTGKITWIPNPPNKIFEYSTAYTAEIEITPKKGYTLVGVPENFFTIKGAKVTNSADSGLVKVIFPKTAGEPITINISTIEGINLPSATQPAVKQITETEQYAGTINWSPKLINGCFDYNTKYTANIKLTAKPGFTLKEISKDFFTIKGANTANEEESGIITAIFPPTAKEVTISELSGVPVPEAKQTCSINKIETEQYVGEITWSPKLTNGSFEYNTVYTMQTKLNTKQGYTFAGLKETFFKINGAKTTFDANSKTVTAVFPVTEKGITIDEVPDVPIPVAGEEMENIKIDTIEYSGTVSWSPSPADKIFDHFTQYTAKIALELKPGYTAKGLEKNFFKIKGAKVSNDAESVTITAIFRKTLKTSYGIGDEGPAGGIVFYIDNANDFDWTYLEVTPYDPQRKSRWGSNNAIKGSTKNKEIGSGQVATEAILATGDEYTLATFCQGFTYGGYNDWFCPSVDELVTVYENLVKPGIANDFSTKSFWTSTEDGFDTAFTISFYNGSCSSGIYKKASKNLLLIRSF